MGEITLTWTAPWSGGSPILAFRISRSASRDALSFLQEIAPATSFTDTDRPLATNAYYRVSAVNVVGEGAPSDGACSAPFPWVATRGSVAVDSTCPVAGHGGCLRHDGGCAGAAGPVAASGTGSATCHGERFETGGYSSGPCVAASATGDPGSHGGAPLDCPNNVEDFDDLVVGLVTCTPVRVLPNVSGVAVTGTGNASCSESGCIAVSGTGHAHADRGGTAVIACDTLAALCLDPA